MPAYTLPIDVINGALVRLGAERIRTLTDHSVQAIEGNVAYDSNRLSELRRSVWVFATRRAILRATSTTTVLWTPAAYAAATTYAHGAVVTYGGEWWESQVGTNLAHTPSPGPYWQHYFGVDSADTYDSTTSYFSGDLVVGSNSSVYRALTNANTVDPVAVGTGWLLMGGTSATLSILYPIGAGPAADSMTRNVFRLPRGYLRKAPTDPKAGVNPYLGGPVNAWSEDWVFENGYVISQTTGPMLLRYVADITDVSTMDQMFADMLADCIAEDIAPRILAGEPASVVQAKIANVRYSYRGSKAEAIAINGIEKGPTEAWEDDWITVRY